MASMATVATLYQARMVAEQDITAMKASLDGLLEDKAEHQRKVEKLESEVKKLNDTKDAMGDALGTRFAQITNEMNTAEGNLQELYRQAHQKFADVDNFQADKFKVTEEAARIKFSEIEENLRNSSGGGEGKKSRKSGFLPEKMMIPKSFDKDISVWRKWKEEVTKYFDDEQEGMKRVMDAVSRVEKRVTEAVLQ